MPTGTFILSLDCEGKWGIADHITDHHREHLTSANLIKAYRDLLAAFEQRDISATFAFVLALTLAPAEYERHPEWFVDVEVDGANWLRHFRADAERGAFEGWFLPEAFDMVRASGRHELACHGFSHLPLGEGAVSPGDAERELATAAEVARGKNVVLKTFVFPRNQIGHVGLLKTQGYLGYRDRLAPLIPGRLGQVHSLLGELNPFRPSHAAIMAGGDGLTPIPPGYFLNWRFGPRRLVPPAVTLRGWRNIIDHAIRHGGVAHLWLHPENLVDGPGTFESLDGILSIVAARRDAGELEVLTQEDYCARHMHGGNAPILTVCQATSRFTS